MQFVHLLHSVIELRPEDRNAGRGRLLLEELNAAMRHVTQTGAQAVQLRLQLLHKKEASLFLNYMVTIFKI